jgi:hypothetical protein
VKVPVVMLIGSLKVALRAVVLIGTPVAWLIGVTVVTVGAPVVGVAPAVKVQT